MFVLELGGIFSTPDGGASVSIFGRILLRGFVCAHAAIALQTCTRSNLALAAVLLKHWASQEGTSFRARGVLKPFRRINLEGRQPGKPAAHHFWVTLFAWLASLKPAILGFLRSIILPTAPPVRHTAAEFKRCKTTCFLRSAQCWWCFSVVPACFASDGSTELSLI